MEYTGTKIEMQINKIEQNPNKRFEENEHTLYDQYLLLQGKPYVDAKEDSFKEHFLSNITPDNILDAMKNLEYSCSTALNGLDYLNYDIISNYYLGN